MSKTFFQNWLFADKAIYIFFLLEVVSSASVNRIYHSCFIWSRRATSHSCTFTINTKRPLNDEKSFHKQKFKLTYGYFGEICGSCIFDMSLNLFVLNKKLYIDKWNKCLLHHHFQPRKIVATLNFLKLGSF